jgi:hypothetical protein
LKHYASPAFWSLYGKLPAEVRALADKNYEILKADRGIRRYISNALGPCGPCESVATIERSVTTLRTEFSGFGSGAMLTTTSLSANKQLQRTVIRNRGRGASA